VPPADGRSARPPVILCAGLAVLDQVFRLDHFPGPQEKSQAHAFVTVGGGCAANAAVAAARLGGVARMTGPIGGPRGDDMIGDRILAGLAREGVDCTGLVRVEGVPSSISAILVDASGERIIVNFRDERLAVARPADPDALVASADAVLADNRFPDFVLPICTAARARGLNVVIDADKPTHEGDALIEIATHVVFSAEGLRAIGDHDDLAVALEQVAQRSPAFLTVTDGARGALWRDRGRLEHLPAFEVRAVDTLGAGDVFHGAFTLALAEGRTERDALRFASAAAAVKCTRFGGIAGAPTRAEVEALLI